MDEEQQQRKRQRQSNWSELSYDLWLLILCRLSRVEAIRLSTVCCSWRKLVQTHISSSSANINTVPWLILPPSKPEEQGCRFYSIDEKKYYTQKNGACNDFVKSQCVGSSHGWLVLFDNENVNLLYLLNPFSGIRILLPPMADGLFYKAILSSSPFQGNGECGVILIYNNKSKIACWRSNVDGNWNCFDGLPTGCYYRDVICHNNHIYALSSTSIGSTSVQVWDLQNIQKVMEIEPLNKVDIRVKGFEYETEKVDCFRINYYLVESLGDILLVLRLVSYYTNRHHTPRFKVWKMDLKVKKWIELDSLEDRVLFLGGNHSLSLSAKDFAELQNNSIYYTDDNPFLFDENIHSYSTDRVGHDMGVFPLASERPELHACHQSRMESPPVWVVPNPW